MIPEQQQNKLEARSRKCIFLGYSNTSKAYRLYDEENKKVILSRDVIFLEFEKAPITIDKQLACIEFDKLQSIRLKLPGFADYILNDVIYLSQLKINLIFNDFY